MRAVTNAGPKARNSGDLRWHVPCCTLGPAPRSPPRRRLCGVRRGYRDALTAICEWLDFGRQDRDFWLFDTFAGIPDEQMTDAERAGIGGWHNRESDQECFAEAQASFAEWPRCHLILWCCPGQPLRVPNNGGRRLTYLSIDMNICAARDCGDQVLLGSSGARCRGAAGRLRLGHARIATGGVRRLRCRARRGDFRLADRSGYYNPLTHCVHLVPCSSTSSNSRRLFSNRLSFSFSAFVRPCRTRFCFASAAVA